MFIRVVLLININTNNSYIESISVSVKTHSTPSISGQY